MNKPSELDSFSHSVVVRIDPSRLENPDLDVPWELERELRASDVVFAHDGYGFARHSDAMFLSFATSDPTALVQHIVDIFETHVVLENRLSLAAQVAVATRKTEVVAGHEFDDHEIVYPEQDKGARMID